MSKSAMTAMTALLRFKNIVYKCYGSFPSNSNLAPYANFHPSALANFSVYYAVNLKYSQREQECYDNQR